MSLITGRRLNLQHFKPMPLPQEVINRVHRLARRNPSGLDLLVRDLRPFLDVSKDDNNDDSTYIDMDDKGN